MLMFRRDLLGAIVMVAPAFPIRRRRTPTPTRTPAPKLTLTPTLIPMPTATPTPTQVQTVGSRINWRGQEVYVHGCNMAWNHYTTDFGGGADGIANNQPTIDSWFSQIQAVGMNTIRWFMFPTDDPNGPYQITRDSNNLPNGIADSVWVDLDAALSLANTHDLTLNLVILNQPTNMPSAWRDTANGREALVDALEVMFSRYANHPRIFGFESFAEADNYIYTGTDGQRGHAELLRRHWRRFLQLPLVRQPISRPHQRLRPVRP
jgi:hypothetical protein